MSFSSPALPASVDGTNRTRSPSPCVDLDGLSSDDSAVDVTPQDYKITLLCDSDGSRTPVGDSDGSRTPVGSVTSSSEGDSPLGPRQGDQRKVLRRNDLPPERSDSVSRPASETTGIG